jgi:hypothetical protein
VSRVRSLSVRSRWAIVLGLTTLTFAVAQRASAAPPATQMSSGAKATSTLSAVTAQAMTNMLVRTLRVRRRAQRRSRRVRVLA